MKDEQQKDLYKTLSEIDKKKIEIKMKEKAEKEYEMEKGKKIFL